MEARLDAEFGRDTDDSGWNLLFLVIYMYLIVCLTIAWFLVSLSWMLHIYLASVWCLPGDSAQGLDEVDDLYCVACDKTFKSSKA